MSVNVIMIWDFDKKFKDKVKGEIMVKFKVENNGNYCIFVKVNKDDL